MTIEEVNYLLSVLNKEGLQKTRKILLNKREMIRSQIRKEELKKYLITQYDDFKFQPYQIYRDNEKLVFTNGISIYFINNNIFKFDENLDTKYKLISLDTVNGYEKKVIKSYGNESGNILEYYTIKDRHFVRYKDVYNFEEFNIQFKQNEIDMCNNILTNPDYSISISVPLLKAESEVGKAYIYGYSKNPKI